MRKNRKPQRLSNLAMGMVQFLVVAGPVTAQIPCGGYEVTAIIQAPKCPPFGYPPTSAWGLNEQGWVVGSFNACVIGPDVAWLWTPELGMQVIPMPAGTSYSRAVAISGSLIVGEYDNAKLELGRTGFLYNYETDEFTSLGTLPGGDWSEAHAIDRKGEIVGFWQNSQVGPRHGFIFENGIMQSLGDDLGTPNSQANDVNNDSKVTGWMGSSPQIDVRAFIWDDGRVRELPPIPGGFTSEGWTINNLQDVAGRGRFFDPDLNATVWRAFAFIDGQAINLGTLPGIEKSLGIAINDAQIVVGFAQTPPLVAFVWQDGKMTALNDLIPPGLGLDFSTARGINQPGQIVASATNEFNDLVAVLLTPIQAPPGDLNNDCQVGVKDLLILLGNWGPCDDCGNCPADLDGNCVVGVKDLLMLLGNWG